MVLARPKIGVDDLLELIVGQPECAVQALPRCNGHGLNLLPPFDSHRHVELLRRTSLLP